MTYCRPGLARGQRDAQPDLPAAEPAQPPTARVPSGQATAQPRWVASGRRGHASLPRYYWVRQTFPGQSYRGGAQGDGNKTT